MLPYGNVWRESRRLFKRYFDSPHHVSIRQPQDIQYVRGFLGQLLQRPNYFLQHARTYVLFTIYLIDRPFISSHSQFGGIDHAIDDLRYQCSPI